MERDYKGATNLVLLDYYQRNGITKTMNVAKAMLKAGNHKSNTMFHAHTHGEICETVLEIILQEYIKANKLSEKGWFFKKGLILKDINNPDSPFLTELDLTLFTPKCILIFECKSYGGDKEITDICTIKRKGKKPFNVYKQNSLHAKVLYEQFKPFMLVNESTINEKYLQLVLFNFSLGEVVDKRTESCKNIMPSVNEESVISLLNKIRSGKDLWNIAALKKAAEIICKHSEDYKKEHLKYVKSLKH